MEIVSKSIRHVQSKDVYGHKELFLKIIEDMFQYAGRLRPTANWDLQRGGKDGGEYFQKIVVEGKNMDASPEYEFSDGHYDEHFSSLNKMMEPWVGCTGKVEVTPEVAKDYIKYLSGIDNLNLLDEYFDVEGNLKEGRFPLMITDLGSIMDVNLITHLLKNKSKITVIEVGGGYGRLAEVFMNLFGPQQVNYVLVDAVPASLMYAELYLKNRFPDINIGSFYNNDEFDLDKYPCYVMPAWHFERLNREKYDVCINIQSMQEMGQEHVDYYLNLFNNILNDGGLVYLSNEKDYVFRGQWNYPSNWRKIFQNRTPRSWTRHSPTEILIKETGGNFSQENSLIDFMYQKQLMDQDALRVFKEQGEEESKKKLVEITEKLNSIEQSINTSLLLKLKCGKS